MDIPHFEDALFLCGDSVILPQRADPGQTFKTLVFDESSVLSLRKESRSLDPPSERDPKGGKVPKSPSTPPRLTEYVRSGSLRVSAKPRPTAGQAGGRNPQAQVKQADRTRGKFRPPPMEREQNAEILILWLMGPPHTAGGFAGRGAPG